MTNADITVDGSSYSTRRPEYSLSTKVWGRFSGTADVCLTLNPSGLWDANSRMTKMGRCIMSSGNNTTPEQALSSLRLNLAFHGLPTV